MEHVAHLRLSGHADAFSLAPPAHERLLRYLADSRLALNADPDRDETVRDLEAALGEHLRLILGETGGPVDDAQMARVLAEIGTVESQQPPDDRSSSRPPRRSFWCRIGEGRWFGGICVGIAARSDLRLDWVRTIAIFLMLVTGGLIGFVYLGLIVVLPHVATVEEYRRLRDSPRSLPAS